MKKLILVLLILISFSCKNHPSKVFKLELTYLDGKVITKYYTLPDDSEFNIGTQDGVISLDVVYSNNIERSLELGVVRFKEIK